MLSGGTSRAVSTDKKPTTDNDMKQKLNLTQEWDKVFPLSEKVNHRKVTFETQYGLTLAADLYTPKTGEKLPAIAVSGPFGAVKEQSSGLYAMRMAERGFVALAFDPSYTGESSGEPHRTASPDINTEDFMAAVDFLSKQENVDAEKIGIIGICGWGGIALNAAAADTRIKATVASTMYDMTRVSGNGYYDNENKYSSKISKDMSMSVAKLEEKLGYKLFVNLEAKVGTETYKQIKEESMANKGNDNKVYCSFCGRSEDQVRKLIAGPAGVYICDECIDICADILEEELEDEEDDEALHTEINVLKPKEIKSFLDEYVIGQEAAKRAAEIAAAGGHNLIMIGAPGSGKSSMAKALSGILPPMTLEESSVTNKIYSVAGKTLRGRGLFRERPFRAPHNSSSLAAFLGGGSGDNIMPGEVSLAHNGVLFIDEFAEMPKSILEALRGPLEDRKVTVSRLRAKVVYPASFMLVAASNPCPCGYYGEEGRCTCSAGQRMGYLSRLSGPVMDRIDLQVWVHPVDAARLVSREKAEPSAMIAARVEEARNIQRERFRESGIFTNAEMSNREIERFCPLSDESRATLEKIIGRLGLSARAYTRIIKIARTIADLSSGKDILPAHIAEAASFRFLDRREF